ncbi:hypothetical protein JHK85_010117 [Glycine max]|nr:hypothetical protein JHK85_010117 [Glycine max]
MSLVCATHDEWHVCNSTVLKTQDGQFPGQSSTGLAKPKGQWILVIRLEAGRIKLLVEQEMGLPVPIEHRWHSISHDINSQDLEKMEGTGGLSMQRRLDNNASQVPVE